MSSRIKSRATSVFTTSVFTTSIFTTSDLSLVAGEFADQVQGFVCVPPTRKASSRVRVVVEFRIEFRIEVRIEFRIEYSCVLDLV